jgi:hypothetical protein
MELRKGSVFLGEGLLVQAKNSGCQLLEIL